MPSKQKNHITELIKSAKERFDNFSDAETQEVFITIREAKARGLLRKQPPDRCLSRYINAANHLLSLYSTDEKLVAEINKHSAVYVQVPTVKDAEKFIDELAEAIKSGNKNFFLRRMWRP